LRKARRRARGGGEGAALAASANHAAEPVVAQLRVRCNIGVEEVHQLHDAVSDARRRPRVVSVRVDGDDEASEVGNAGARYLAERAVNVETATSEDD
jgi:hypothetical protein